MDHNKATKMFDMKITFLQASSYTLIALVS